MRWNVSWRRFRGFAIAAGLAACSAHGFEGSIRSVLTQNGREIPISYIVSADFVRVEAASDAAHLRPINIIDRHSGGVVLVFPRGQNYVRLTKPAASAPVTPRPNWPPPTPAAGPPGAAWPVPPAFAGERLELKSTGARTNMLGLDCEEFEIKQHNSTMKVWATHQLFPFRGYQANQPHRSVVKRIETEWEKLLADQELFPLMAAFKYSDGKERFRFEVKSIESRKLTEEEKTLFQPPPGYREIAPLPF